LQLQIDADGKLMHKILLQTKQYPKIGDVVTEMNRRYRIGFQTKSGTPLFVEFFVSDGKGDGNEI